MIENEIVEVLDKKYKIDCEKVEESVENCKLDRYHAMYYLTLKHEKHTHEHISNTHLDEFRKKRKSSLLKLNPISKTPSLSKKKETTRDYRDDQLLTLKNGFSQNKNHNIRIRPKMTLDPRGVDPENCRFRKDSPDSPRRLLDCVGAYKGY